MEKVSAYSVEDSPESDMQHKVSATKVNLRQLKSWDLMYQIDQEFIFSSALVSNLQYIHYFLGSVELFRDPCEGDLESYFHSKGHFSGFIEGWAMYSENPVLSDDVMLYKDNPLQKLGMYKWQVGLQVNFSTRQCYLLFI